jgi:hypothetical protein
MHDPLHRLYRTKLALLASVLLFLGLGLLIFGHWVQHAAGWQWLANWPILDIGSGMFTTGLLGVALQYLDGEDSEVRDTERLKRVLADSTPAMRDAVISGFAFQPEDLARVATTEVLDKIITNGLAIRLGDASFADEIYDDLRQQAIGIPERLHDARIAIRLSPLPLGKAGPSAKTMLFAVTVRWEFSVIPAYATRRFICLDDLDEFRELNQDTVATSAWYFKPKAGLIAADKAAFELIEFTVDGEPRSIRRSTKTGSQTYTVSLGRDTMGAAEPVTVAYTYRTVTAANGHLLRLRVDQPTRGLAIELDYGDTDITDVTVVDFIASSEQTRISRSPNSVAGRTVAIDFDGWVFPRSGVAFVWMVDDSGRPAHR